MVSGSVLGGATSKSEKSPKSSKAATFPGLGVSKASNALNALDFPAVCGAGWMEIDGDIGACELCWLEEDAMGVGRTEEATATFEGDVEACDCRVAG